MEVLHDGDHVGAGVLRVVRPVRDYGRDADLADAVARLPVRSLRLEDRLRDPAVRLDLRHPRVADCRVGTRTVERGGSDRRDAGVRLRALSALVRVRKGEAHVELGAGEVVGDPDPRSIRDREELALVRLILVAGLLDPAVLGDVLPLQEASGLQGGPDAPAHERPLRDGRCRVADEVLGEVGVEEAGDQVLGEHDASALRLHEVELRLVAVVVDTLGVEGLGVWHHGGAAPRHEPGSRDTLDGRLLGSDEPCAPGYEESVVGRGTRKADRCAAERDAPAFVPALGV